MNMKQAQRAFDSIEHPDYYLSDHVGTEDEREAFEIAEYFKKVDDYYGYGYVPATSDERRELINQAGESPIKEEILGDFLEWYAEGRDEDEKPTLEHCYLSPSQAEYIKKFHSDLIG